MKENVTLTLTNDEFIEFVSKAAQDQYEMKYLEGIDYVLQDGKILEVRLNFK